MTIQLHPLVSVCIPTYQGATHLGSAIESVLAQTLDDFELLILDDNSPDATREIVASYGDKRIRYLCNPMNLGAQDNWNRALAESRGRYFKLLPHDDILYPQTLEQQVEVLAQDETESIALIFGPRDIINSHGKVLLQRGKHNAAGYVSAAQIVLRCVRAGTNVIGEPGAVLMRKSLVERVGLFRAEFPYFLDLDYWFRALRLGDAWRMPDPVSAFRVWRGSLSVNIWERQTRDFSGLVARLREEGNSFEISYMDWLYATTKAQVNQLGRALFYRFLIP